MKVCIRCSQYPTTYREGKQGGNKWGEKKKNTVRKA